MIKLVDDADFPYKNTHRSTNKIIVNIDFINCKICKNAFYDFDKKSVCRDCERGTKESKNPASGVA